MIEEKRVVKSDPVELWSKKYQPTELRQVIGQETQIKNLRNWLRDWEDVHVRGNKKEAREAYNSFRPAGNINSKAALLSGEAGLGKTTTARLLAK
jgi:replication factor C subunit 1